MAPKSEPQNYEFVRLTCQLDPNGALENKVLKMRKTFAVAKQSKVGVDGKVTITGEIDPDKFLKCLAKVRKYAKNVEYQHGECSTNLVEKKKEEAIKTNNNNQDMGPIYPSYYGGYNNNSNGYGYDYTASTFGGNNYAYYNNNHLECGGHAADCDSYHMQRQRDHHNSTSSAKPPANKSSSTSTKPEEKPSSVSFKKLGHKEKRGCIIM